MSSHPGGGSDADPREIVMLEPGYGDEVGPPLQVSSPDNATGSPADSMAMRVQDVLDRTRPAALALVMLAAIGASIAFAWQSRLGGDDTAADLDQALADAGSLSSLATGSTGARESDGGMDAEGRSAGSFQSDSTTTTETPAAAGRRLVRIEVDNHLEDLGPRR